MAKIINKLSRIFNRNSIRELKDVSEAIDQQLNTASEDINLLDLEYVVKTASGQWLDEWGTWFGIPRIFNEADEEYANRIIASTTKTKSTIPAFQETIRAYLNDDNIRVVVYEPFTDIMRYSHKGTLSEEGRFQDATYYRVGVVDIQMTADVDATLVETMEKVKGAGIKVYFTRIDELGYYDDPVLAMKPEINEQANEVAIDIELKTNNPYMQVSSFSGNVDKPMSGRQVLFYTFEREFDRKVYYNTSKIPTLVYNYIEKNISVKYAKGYIEAILTKENDLPLGSPIPTITRYESIVEKNIEAYFSKKVLSGSEKVISTVAHLTVRELSSMSDYDINSVEIQIVP